MIYLSLEEVIFLHEYQIQAFGGLPGILSTNLLESAVLRPQASFSGKELYESVFEKAAILTIGIIQNHPFIDGNKRTGLYAGLVFLNLNGIILKISNKNLVDIALSIVRKDLSVEALAELLKNSELPKKDKQKLPYRL